MHAFSESIANLLPLRTEGPFEYWLTRTRAQDVEDLSILDEYIETLQRGSLPEALRGLNRAAGAFPNHASTQYKKG